MRQRSRRREGWPKKGNKLWRIHSAFDFPGERFGFFELTDELGGETLDRIPVVKGEIRLADRAYLQPERIAGVLDQGADLVVRAGWRNARWLDDEGQPVHLLAEFRKASDELRGKLGDGVRKAA